MNKVSKALIEGKLLQRAGKYIKNFINKQVRRIDEALGIAFRQALSPMLKIEENKIVFMTYQNQYTCNPKYICNYLLEHYDGIKIVWVVDEKTLYSPEAFEIPQQVKLVKRNSSESFIELMTAKIWIDNALNCIWRIIPKKKEQVYLNTWHGSLGIKRLDTYDSTKGYWRYIARKSNQYIDYMLVNSNFEINVFRNSYWPNVQMLKTGHARNDLFFNQEAMNVLSQKVKNFYNIDTDTKLLLYAPTFREDKTIDCYDMDYQMVQKALVSRFPGKWKILLRLHFHNRKSVNTNYNKCIIDATNYPDIQELMTASDVGITDYSSWIYDYMLTMRPCFIYASDIEKYNDTRGFYYPLEETPFLIARNNDELCNNINSFSQSIYIEKVKKFLTEKGCIENGKACKSIVNEIVKYLQ